MCEPTDEQLVAAVRGGDAGALGLLMERHEIKCFNKAIRIVGNEHDASDVTQEVLLKVQTKLDQYDRSKCVFAAWLLTMVGNESLMLLRRRNRKCEAKESTDHQDPPDLASLLRVQQDTSDLQRKAFDALHKEDQEILILQKSENLRIGEIAARLGCNENTLKTRLQRARRTVMENYERLIREEANATVREC